MNKYRPNTKGQIQTFFLQLDHPLPKGRMPILSKIRKSLQA